MHSLHSSQIAARRSVFRRRLFDADDTQNWPAGAELNVIANPHLCRAFDGFSVYKSSKSRVGVADIAAAVVQAKLGMLARDHRPLLLRKEIMTDSGVAPDEDDVAAKGVLTMQLAAAILCEN